LINVFGQINEPIISDLFLARVSEPVHDIRQAPRSAVSGRRFPNPCRRNAARKRACEAQAAGPLTPRALATLLKEAMRRRAKLFAA
jgi:hypothetical protein